MLLVGWETVLILKFGFDNIDGVGRLHLGDSLARYWVHRPGVIAQRDSQLRQHMIIASSLTLPCPGSLPLHLYSTLWLMAFPVRVAIAHILISMMTGLTKAEVDSTGTNSRDIETSKLMTKREFCTDMKRLPKLGSK